MRYLQSKPAVRLYAPQQAVVALLAADEAATESLRTMSVEAFRALDLRGFARVDFLVRRSDGAVFLNEVNTLPGFTPISMFPKLWDAAGLGYPALIEQLVELALEAAGD